MVCKDPNWMICMAFWMTLHLQHLSCGDISCVQINLNLLRILNTWVTLSLMMNGPHLKITLDSSHPTKLTSDMNYFLKNRSREKCAHVALATS